MRRALVPVVLVAASFAACKREPRYRDLATLPHVERTRGKVAPEKVPWAYDYQLGNARICYDQALEKDSAQRGTVTVTATRPSDFGNVDITTTRTGTISGELEKCIAWEFRAPPGVQPKSKETVTLKLAPVVVREAKPPGDFAFHRVIRKMVEPANVRVVSMDVRREPDELGQNRDRYAKAQCTVKVEFLKDGEDDWCGSLRPLGGPRCRGKWEAGDPCDCAKVKRKKGAQVELKGEISATLHGKNGWAFTMGEYDDGRRFFGDETREVE
ncbi:MAG: hypothetical protein IPM35_33420 [Myxococcales bacterium]|nr:hypothetical protein [Myxococcales bacterium]